MHVLRVGVLSELFQVSAALVVGALTLNWLAVAFFLILFLLNVENKQTNNNKKPQLHTVFKHIKG